MVVAGNENNNVQVEPDVVVAQAGQGTAEPPPGGRGGCRQRWSVSESFSCIRSKIVRRIQSDRRSSV